MSSLLILKVYVQIWRGFFSGLHFSHVPYHEATRITSVLTCKSTSSSSLEIGARDMHFGSLGSPSLVGLINPFPPDHIGI